MVAKEPETIRGMMRKIFTGDDRKNSLALLGDTKKKNK